MGGKGSGGARIGTGPKPKNAAMALVHGSRDSRTRPTVPQDGATLPVVAREAVEAPENLPAEQRAVWDRWAPQAVAAGTLTAGTALGFAHLCKCIWAEGVLLEKIQAADWQVDKVTLQMDEKGGGLQQVEKKASDLITKWQAMLVRVENGMARYRLTADGKDRGVAQPAKPVSALERLQAQARQMRGAK